MNEEINICPAYKSIQLLSGGVMREGFAFSFDFNKIQYCSFSPSFLCVSYEHAAAGLLHWNMELLAFSSRQFAPRIVDLSPALFAVCSSILPCGRA